MLPLVSKVPGYTGTCKPTWINRNMVDRRVLGAGAISGFFRLTKKVRWWPFRIATGKEFHGVLLPQSNVIIDGNTFLQYPNGKQS